ncbi:MAG: hypothetical protein AABZ78_17895 [Chloroflexota bacterium]
MPDGITTTIGDHEVLIEQKDDGIYVITALSDAKEEVIAEALQSGSTVIDVKDTVAGVEITLQNAAEESEGENTQ